MTGIVGRRTELAELTRMLVGVRDGGGGRLVLVTGPAGIGKTALTAAALALAQDAGMATAHGQAVDDPGAPPLWPWLRATRGWSSAESLPAPEQGEPDAAARFRLFEAVADAVTERSQAAGLVLLLEDMHWADATSVQLLRHMVNDLGERRVAILVTYRDGVGGPMLDAAGQLASSHRAQLIALPGLEPSDVAAWLPQLTGSSDPALAAALHQATSGNPLLVRLVAHELALHGAGVGLGALMSERPELRRLVASRVAALSVPARDVVAAAAVLGEDLALEAVAAVTGRDVGELDGLLAEALRARVFRADGARLAFEHALVRDAVYAELTPARRAELHRRAAAVLAEQDPTLAGSIATHYRRAGDAESVEHCVAWAQRAVEQARTRLAWSDAARFAELAVTAARRAGAPPEEIARLLVSAAEALFLSGAVRQSLTACQQAADLAEAAGRPDLLAAAALVVHGIGDPARHRVLSQLADRALAALPADALAFRARLHAQAAVAAAETQGGAAGTHAAQQALAEAEASRDPAAVLEAVAARHLAICAPHTVAERLELGSRAIALAAVSERPIAALWGHLWRTDAALQLGNLRGAEQEIGEIAHIAETKGSVLASWHENRYRALRAALAGDFEEARRANAVALDLGRRCDEIGMLGLSYAFQVQLAVLRGDVGEIDPSFPDFHRLAPPMPLVRLTGPLLHAVEGRLEQAKEEFEEFRGLPVTYPVGVRWLGTIVHVAMVAHLLEDAETAAATHDALAPVAGYYASDGSGAVFNHGALARLAGEMALTAGRIDDAVTLLRDAVAMNARIGARPFTALSRLELARALVLSKRPDKSLTEAAELAGRAAVEFARLDMPAPLARAERLRAEIAAARRCTSSLSRRETEIAELVAEALSNSQIADRLVLSERTVESHVRNILNKLGLRTRTEIATWVIRNQLETG